MQNIQAITFDAAGTLICLRQPVGRVYADMAQRYGLSLDGEELQKRFTGSWARMPMPHAGTAAEEDPEDADERERRWWRELVRQTLAEANAAASRFVKTDEFDQYFADLFAFYGEPDAWEVFADVVPLLTSLPPGIGLGVVSNFDSRIFPILEGLGLMPWFHQIVISATACASKPDPRIYKAAAAALGVAPETILHVGDDPERDWEGAAKAGFQVYRLERPDYGLAGVGAMLLSPPTAAGETRAD